jgi:hypothetical protein
MGIDITVSSRALAILCSSAKRKARHADCHRSVERDSTSGLRHAMPSSARRTAASDRDAAWLLLILIGISQRKEGYDYRVA